MGGVKNTVGDPNYVTNTDNRNNNILSGNDKLMFFICVPQYVMHPQL